MIPALMVVLLVVICGILPAHNLVTEKGIRHYRGDECDTGRQADFCALKAYTVLDYGPVGYNPRYPCRMACIWP